MTQVEDLNLYFVLRSESANQKDCSEDMKGAFDVVLQYGGNAEWVVPSFCVNYKPKDKDVFIFDQFEGTAFDRLKENKGKILGARCILTSITNGRSIPPGPSPIFTEGMRDLIVCSSGFDKATKKLIETRITYMGGLYDQSLRSITTHIVAHNNISKKAINCYKSKKPVMVLDWLEAVWSKSLYCNVNGNDDEFKKYISPIFHNLKITTSGISRVEKEKLKALITNNGGTFTGIMNEETSIVVLAKPEGEKYKYAQSWNIPGVKPSWIFDCVQAKSILPLTDYTMDFKKPKASTPKKGCVDLTANFSMISNIGIDPDKNLTQVNETFAATLSNGTMRSEFQTPRALPPQVNTPVYADVIDYVLLKNAREAGQYLDGCNIFLSGFNAEYSEKLRKILNMAGATRFNELSASVTHIIVGNGNDNRNISSFEDKGAYVLPIEWLVECMKTKRLATETSFSLLKKMPQPVQSPSPLSKQGAKLLSRTENRNISKPSFNLEASRMRDFDDELLSKYNESQQGEPILQPVPTPVHTSASTSASSISSSVASKTRSQNEKVFKGLNFYLSRELAEDESKTIEDVIIERGGRVIGKRFTGISDYAVVPIGGASLHEVTAKEVVNVFYIKDCCLESTIVPLQYYHLPVTSVRNTTPLTNCVISVSNYVQCEREFIELLIDHLGAICQSQLARKTKDGVPKSTHLVCAEPSGQKYEGAVRWGIPVIHHDWLIKCAAVGARVSENDYLVGKSKLSASTVHKSGRETSTLLISKKTDQTQKSSSSTVHKNAKDQPGSFWEPGILSTNQKTDLTQQCSSSSSSVPSIVGQISLATTVPVKKPKQYPSDRDSPVHNAIARLRAMETPKNGDSSPDNNRTITPTSPYGAFYGNDNPSPGTRKRLHRWMQQGVDFPQDSPTKVDMEPKKRDSTPLSEVLSRYLKSMKRKPEDLPPDSPTDIPAKKLNLDSKDDNESESDNENDKESENQQDRIVSIGLKKMKEIEQNIKKNSPKSTTPVRKSHDNVQPQMLIVAESQPHTEIGWEDPTEKELALGKLEKAAESELAPKIFMLSFLDDMDSIIQLIEDCGGKVSTFSHFDKSATHLITGNMKRGEKLVCSMAAGIWVLHPSYLEQLASVRNFNAVSEEEYEWGNPNHTLRTRTMTGKDKDFAQYSSFWRKNREMGKDPPFKYMKIIVHLPPSKSESFKRLIEAGGGDLVNAKPPFSGDLDATVCVSDLAISDEIDMKSLARQRIALVSLVFINDQILQVPNAIENNLLPTFKKYWSK